jgi:hypothetical protein
MIGDGFALGIFFGRRLYRADGDAGRFVFDCGFRRRDFGFWLWLGFRFGFRPRLRFWRGLNVVERRFGRLLDARGLLNHRLRLRRVSKPRRSGRKFKPSVTAV